MRRRRRVGAAGEVEQQRIADLDREPRLVGAFRRLDLQDVDRAQVVAQDRAAGHRALAIERLEAARRPGPASASAAAIRAEPGLPRLSATTLTILCGTTITFLGGLPVKRPFYRIERQNGSLDLGVRRIAGNCDIGALLAVDLDRKVMVSSISSSGSSFGQGSRATSVRWPSAAQHSSARCGIIGWNSRTRMSTASRTAQR